MDPENRMYGGHEKKKKKGFFKGKVTWVVYILTTVQVGVFIGELINNGMFFMSSAIGIHYIENHY